MGCAIFQKAIGSIR